MKKKICISTSVVLLLLVLFLQCPFGVETDKTLSPLKERDSLAVRAILDSNGLEDVDLSSYDDREKVLWQRDSSIMGLKLDTFNLEKFKFTKEFNSLDSLKNVKLNNNKLKSIFVDDTITFGYLTLMYLSNNELDSFPQQLLKLNNIESLDMRYNNLSNLPLGIMEKSYQTFSIRYNNLTDLPDTLKNWLSQFDSEWEKYQGY